MRTVGAMVVVIATAFLTLNWGSADADTTRVGRYRALIIAVSDYPSAGKGWAKLPAAERDARAIQHVLEKSYGFEENVLLLGPQVTRKAVYDALRAMLQKPENDAQREVLRRLGISAARESDSVLIYFAGHGAVAGTLGYWIPFSMPRMPVVDPDLLRDYAISSADVTNIVSNLSLPRHVLLLVDSCYGGTFAIGRSSAAASSGELSWYRDEYQKKSREVITSGGVARVNDQIWEAAGTQPLLDGHSPFAAKVLDILDNNHSTPFTGGGLYQAIRPEVENQTKNTSFPQNPEYADLRRDDVEETYFIFSPPGVDWYTPKPAPAPRLESISRDGTYHTLTLTADIAGSFWQDGKKLAEKPAGQAHLLETPDASVNLEFRSPCLDTPLTATVAVPSDRDYTFNASAKQQRWCALNMDFITIPGGTFTMGSSDGDSDEKPPHPVTVSTFRMGKTEVTNAQYQACVDAGACTAPGWDKCFVLDSSQTKWVEGKAGPELKGPDKPVFCVDHTQATTFSRWVGGILPTEAQWEYAARGPGGRKYPWGNTPEPTCELAVFDPSSSMDTKKWGCGTGTTAPVCSKTKGNTPEGLCDMAGNVLEWTADWYSAEYYDTLKGRATDPGGPTGPLSDRVARGGSLYVGATRLRGSDRSTLYPPRRYLFMGFRVVMPSAPGHAP